MSSGFKISAMFTLEDPVYRLTAAYNFSALVYARESQLDKVRGREFFSLNGSYRVRQGLTFSLVDTYVKSESSNVGSVEGFSTGLTRTTSNILAPSASYTIDAQTSVRASGSWARQSFDARPSQDSDTYRAEVDLDPRAFVPQIKIAGQGGRVQGAGIDRLQ